MHPWTDPPSKAAIYESKRIKAFEPNPCYPQLSRLLAICYDNTRGRHIRALEDLPLGKVIAIEEGLVVNIQEQRCYHCLDRIRRYSKRYCDECIQEGKPALVPKCISDGDINERGILKLACHVALSYRREEILAVVRADLHAFRSTIPFTLATHDIGALACLEPYNSVLLCLTDPVLQDSIKMVVASLHDHPDWGHLPYDTRLRDFLQVLEFIIPRVAKNAHTIKDMEGEGILGHLPLGSGLFPISSIFNHSCTPNTSSFFHYNKFIFVSRGIRRGEEVCDSYNVTYFTDTLNERRGSCQNVSHFICHCIKCTNERDLDVFLISRGSMNERIRKGSIVFKEVFEEFPKGSIEREQVVRRMLLVPKIGFKNDRRDLWKDWIATWRYRGMIYDKKMVFQFLGYLISIFEETKEGDEERKQAVYMAFALDQMLSTLFADLHPASPLVKTCLTQLRANDVNPRMPLILRQYMDYNYPDLAELERDRYIREMKDTMSIMSLDEPKMLPLLPTTSQVPAPLPIAPSSKNGGAQHKQSKKGKKSKK